MCTQRGVHTPLKSTFSDMVSSWLANMLYVQNRVFKKQTNWNYKIITQRNPEGLVRGWGMGVEPGEEGEKGSWKGAITHVKLKITGLMNGQKYTQTDFSSKHELLIIRPIKIRNGLFKEVCFPSLEMKRQRLHNPLGRDTVEQTECQRRRKLRSLLKSSRAIHLGPQTTTAPAPTNLPMGEPGRERCDLLTLTSNSECTSWENEATDSEEFTKSVLSHR